jgi:hypothetical protein
MISLDKKYKTVGGHEVELEKIQVRVTSSASTGISSTVVYISGKWEASRGNWYLADWDVETGYLYGTDKPGKLSLIEIEENMISLDKKYVTASGNEVVLLEIYDNQVFGRVKSPTGQEWVSSHWDIDGSHTYRSHFNLREVPEFKIVTLKQNFTKPVLYYGILFTVPKNINYMATDKDGTVFGYSTKPILEGGGNMWVNTDFIDGVEIGVVEFEGDWRQSLQQV